ncbi:MAG TPA: TonB family protein [Terracidiphilus sp.]|jgi:protein TonB
MFEDSTFESTGRIKTRSRRWMFATFALNGAILATLILIPLIYPNALPSHMLPSLIVAPEAPKPEPPPQPVHVQPARPHFSDFDAGRLIAPPTIPHVINTPSAPEPAFQNNIATDTGIGGPNGQGTNPFGHGQPVTVVHPPAPATIRLPSRLVEGNIIFKSIPLYPIIAKTAHIEGTVELQATISKTGTIENLRVMSGHPMLQQAAIDAVKTWRYRPYLLNQQPVEVETTVDVIFKLER